MAAHSEPALVPPGDTSAVRALAWAVAVQQAAVATLWMDLLDPFTTRRFSLAGAGAPIVTVAATVAVAHVLVPVAARARSGTSAVVGSMAFCAAGGVLVGLASAPLAYIGSTFAPGVTLLHVVTDGMFGSALAGFFSGMAAATILVHRLRIQAHTLDTAARLYAVAGASLLPAAVILLGFGVSLRGHGALTCGAPFLCAGTGLIYAAFASRRRRLTWLDRVRDGRESGFWIEEAAARKDLPSFVGTGEGARGIVVQDLVGTGAHPFRGDHRPVPVARVHLDPKEVARQASVALRQSLLWGAVAGIAVFFALFVPVCLLALSLGP